MNKHFLEGFNSGLEKQAMVPGLLASAGKFVAPKLLSGVKAIGRGLFGSKPGLKAKAWTGLNRGLNASFVYGAGKEAAGANARRVFNAGRTNVGVTI